MRTIEEVSEFLKVLPEDIVKTLIFNTEKGPVAVLIRGDEEVNEAKLRSYLRPTRSSLPRMISSTKSRRPPRDLRGGRHKGEDHRRLFPDQHVQFCHGRKQGRPSRQECQHRAGLQGRRIRGRQVIKETDPCPRNAAQVLEFARGIEVGHVFKLGTKYSKMMHAVYLDKNGKEQLMQMGCYGIGVGRTVAASYRAEP